MKTCSEPSRPPSHHAKLEQHVRMWLSLEPIAEFQSTFHWHVLDRWIRHVHIKPHTPRLNGKVERSHRIDNEDFYRMLEHVVIIDDAKVSNDKLQEWEDFHRPLRRA